MSKVFELDRIYTAREMIYTNDMSIAPILVVWYNNWYIVFPARFGTLSIEDHPEFADSKWTRMGIHANGATIMEYEPELETSAEEDNRRMEEVFNFNSDPALRLTKYEPFPAAVGWAVPKEFQDRRLYSSFNLAVTSLIPKWAVDAPYEVLEVKDVRALMQKHFPEMNEVKKREIEDYISLFVVKGVDIYGYIMAMYPIDNDDTCTVFTVLDLRLEKPEPEAPRRTDGNGNFID